MKYSMLNISNEIAVILSFLLYIAIHVCQHMSDVFCYFVVL